MLSLTLNVKIKFRWNLIVPNLNDSCTFYQDSSSPCDHGYRVAWSLSMLTDYLGFHINIGQNLYVIVKPESKS